MKTDRRWWNDGRWERECDAWGEAFYERIPTPPPASRVLLIGPDGTFLVARIRIPPVHVFTDRIDYGES